MQISRRNALLSLAITPTILQAAPRATDGVRAPVLVELFTSQGCSSCPPADTLLARLVDEQPIPEAQIIGLSHHVDYWNRLGWKDPYSSSAATERQVRYQGRFRTASVYTPQMVVNGRQEFVGSDVRKALAAIRAAAKGERAVLDVRLSESSLAVAIERTEAAQRVLHGAGVWVAIVRRGARNSVPHGENTGRVLTHRNVVQRLDRAGLVLSMQDRGLRYQIPEVPASASGGAAAVVFVQDRRTMEVFASRSISLSE